jgi:hypothetical protein
MTERPPDAPELREVVADELGYDEVEPDPDQPPGPVPDDDREVPVPDELDLDESDVGEPDVGDFDDDLDA